jgi:multiple sugar transport system ATP-binding protein
VLGDNGTKLTAELAVGRIEYLSGDRHVYGNLKGISDARVIARLPATVTTPIEAGDVREFAVHADDLRFFDADSGRRTTPKAVRA